MFEDLLDVSQIELGVLKFTAEDVELNHLLDQLKATISDAADKKGIEISVIASPGLKARADRRLTLQVLINLVVNSIKYSEDGTKVRVTAIDENGQVSITVADQGIGMDEVEVERAVQRFERLENYFSAKEGGVGIGLPLSKQMVEIQGGTLTLSSRKGFGTTVTVTLPLATSQPSRLRA